MRYYSCDWEIIRLFFSQILSIMCYLSKSVGDINTSGDVQEDPEEVLQDLGKI
jgi:hypothetical protein